MMGLEDWRCDFHTCRFCQDADHVVPIRHRPKSAVPPCIIDGTRKYACEPFTRQIEGELRTDE
ncbi:MAG: hypothetical protein MJE68_21920 [Proteobacteria bacterium]|nr:hypothetical protein [Pseudomonadota bacterium]